VSGSAGTSQAALFSRFCSCQVDDSDGEWLIADGTGTPLHQPPPADPPAPPPPPPAAVRKLVYSEEEEEAEDRTRGSAVGVPEEAQDAGRKATADESPAAVVDSPAAPPGPTNRAEAAHELFGVDQMTTGAHTGGSERAESAQDVRHAQVSIKVFGRGGSKGGRM
jgi:hypothetical protein